MELCKKCLAKSGGLRAPLLLIQKQFISANISLHPKKTYKLTLLLISMSQWDKHYIFCYENWHYSPQIGFITKVHENHPFLLVRSRIDCGEDKENFPKVFESAEAILSHIVLNESYTVDKYNPAYSLNLIKIYEQLKKKGFSDIVLMKAGAKPIDSRKQPRFNQSIIKPRTKILFYFDDSENIYKNSNFNSPALVQHL